MYTMVEDIDWDLSLFSWETLSGTDEDWESGTYDETRLRKRKRGEPHENPSGWREERRRIRAERKRKRTSKGQR